MVTPVSAAALFAAAASAAFRSVGDGSPPPCLPCIISVGTDPAGASPSPPGGAAFASDPSLSVAGSVRVYDGVFPTPSCGVLRSLAGKHSIRATNSDGSSVFLRPPTALPLTALERAIDSVLSALGDDSPIVEYWSRDEHLNMDAHSDVDEGQLEGEGTLRCPAWGHVLYLDVGVGVRGPTCVFPDRLGGWDGPGVAGSDPDPGVTMVTIPAVPGRLLRFDGRAMHAVPRPADRWLLSDEEERRLRVEAEDFGFTDDLDDDSFDDREDRVRSVLLFNTWRGAPPRGVDGDPATGALPSGIELVEDNADGGEEGAIPPVAEGDSGGRCEAETADATVPLCIDPSAWREVMPPSANVNDSGQRGEIPMRVNLMGSARRRLYPTKLARLRGPESIGGALRETKRVTVFRLTKEKETQ